MTTTASRPAPAAAKAARLRLGTRGSALAIAQSSTVAAALRALGSEIELITIRTLGDDRPPDTTWGEGAFVGALEAALLEGTIDLAVHSAKDVPTTEHPRLVIAAYPGREDPRDALVGRNPGQTLDALPAGARVGTDSPRRSAFLRATRPDLRVHALHGNVDTRLRRLDAGDTDALVLAVAGLTRLGRTDRIGEILPSDRVPPAPGQGALAIQCRADDTATRGWLARLDDFATRAAVEAERRFLEGTGGGCRAPIGALAILEGEELIIRAGAAASDFAGDDRRPAVAWGEARGRVEDRAQLAADLAARLTGRLAAVGPAEPSTAARSGGPTVLVTRAADQTGALVEALEARGFDPIAIPTIEIRRLAIGGALDAAVRRVSDFDWIVVTSANGGRAVIEAARRLDIDLGRARWAAVGPASRQSLEARGVVVAFVPRRTNAAGLAMELPIEPGDRILLARGDLADPAMVDALEARGAVVEPVVAYETIEGPAASRRDLRALFAGGGPAVIVFSSGSTVRGLATLLGAAHLRRARRALACCIGEPTAAVARAEGFERVTVAATTAPAAIAADLHGLVLAEPGQSTTTAHGGDHS